MNEKNLSEIGNALNITLRPLLAGFVANKLIKRFGNKNWWQDGVISPLYDYQKRDLPQSGTYAELTDAMDIQLCLLLIEIHWTQIFSSELTTDYFNYVKELKTIRNTWAHKPNAFDDELTLRAFDTMARISKIFDEETTKKLREMRDEKFKSAEKPAVKILAEIKKNSWRNLIMPNDDVASGRYKQAEFAADLGQVVRGEGSNEYKNPTEFFARTYLTDGLKKLLVKTLRHLAFGTGDPVIQLKTSFGGGKTHSLLALYHLFGGKISAQKSPTVLEILNAAEISFLPKVHTAVIVGTWENPLRKTLWGIIAEQLAQSTGKPELYEMMRANDEKGISPGVELLQKLFDTAGACLILMDEIVSYGRKLQEGEINDGGSFGNLMSFLQELTEAAKASRNTAVVVSIPESDAEIGGDLGRKVLVQVEKYFGRVEFVWSPITNVEGYEIVRRRLFKPCRDEQAKREVCAAFFNLYRQNKNDFPFESRQDNYHEKLLACYPIHPQLFDYFYNKWTALEGFQRTRGVLRLMANVIYRLWMSNDNSLLIMPGNIPLDYSPVRDELTKLLGGGNWDAIINTEVDGDHSKPYELDSQNARFNQFAAARKISRNIFMGTAPGDKKGSVRGILESEVRLGVIQPDENENIAVYNDALTKLKANLNYLYSHDTRLWFGVNPTLRKVFYDERNKIPDKDVDFAIEDWLKNWKVKGVFQAVHICPESSADVPDKQTVRLVILLPKYCFIEGLINNPATDEAKNILDNCGTIPRRWKNMLMFMVADADNLRILKDKVRDFLAWQSVRGKAKENNLDILQIEDTNNNLRVAKENFKMKLSQAYCKLLAPEKSDYGDLNCPIKIEKIECLKEENISAASEKFVANEMLLGSLGCKNLLLHLDKFIWRDKDDVQVKQLWEYFATYYYLPRLLNENVLLDAVRRGVAAKTFALAEDFQDGKYINLKFGDVSYINVSPENFLVKAEVAEKQLGIEKPKPEIKIEPAKINPPEIKPKPEIKPPPLPTNFSMSVELDKENYVRNIKKYISEVASMMMNLPNAETSIRLSVEISVPAGISESVQEIVTANCHDLKIGKDKFHFK